LVDTGLSNRIEGFSFTPMDTTQILSNPLTPLP
jgi:hypothetical protein